MIKMKNKMQLNVGVGLILYQDKILLLKRKSSPVPEYDNKWELPGGKIEIGESFEDGIEREVLEETNLKVKCEYILPFSFSKSFIQASHDIHVNVICGKCQISTQLNINENLIENIKWFDIQDIDFKKIIPGSKEFLVWELRDSEVFNQLPQSARLYEIKMEMIDNETNKFKNYFLAIYFDPHSKDKFLVERYYGRIGKTKRKVIDYFSRMNEALEFSQKIINKRKSHGYSITFIQDNHPLYSWIIGKNVPQSDNSQLPLFDDEL